MSIKSGLRDRRKQIADPFANSSDGFNEVTSLFPLAIVPDFITTTAPNECRVSLSLQKTKTRAKGAVMKIIGCDFRPPSPRYGSVSSLFRAVKASRDS